MWAKLDHSHFLYLPAVFKGAGTPHTHPPTQWLVWCINLPFILSRVNECSESYRQLILKTTKKEAQQPRIAGGQWLQLELEAVLFPNKTWTSRLKKTAEKLYQRLLILPLIVYIVAFYFIFSFKGIRTYLYCFFKNIPSFIWDSCTAQQNMGSFPTYRSWRSSQNRFQNENSMHSLKVKTTRPSYSREKKNKYARRNRVGGCFECLWSIK